MTQSTVSVPVQRFGTHTQPDPCDLLVVEEPLEIRLEYGPLGARVRKRVAITMRTPGDDFALAAGFLFAEQIVTQPNAISRISFCGPPSGPHRLRNTVRVSLHPSITVGLERLERNFYTTSSCGVCGKTSLEALALAACPPLPRDGPHIPARLIHDLPNQLRRIQPIFSHTGGLHAAALCTPDGRIDRVREDVGRHNAVDKLIGSRLLAGNLDLGAHLLLVSGRASFELTQKAIVAGIPMLAAVGAPSSLAVELAAAHDLRSVLSASSAARSIRPRGGL
jgi:FdhD protein